jgi:hypothetical protein
MVLLLAALLAIEAPLTDGDVRAFVGKWLAAQNMGDFAAYETLFATRFTGVRRSGPRTVNLDRAGWIRDRARMFRKPMTVGITHPSVFPEGSAARVWFTQTFAQGNYKDEGAKQLVIIREAGALKIASELMLRSRVASPPPTPKDDRFRFVVSGAVLLSESPDLEWGTGPITYVGGEPAVAARRVDARKLPRDLARWRGRPVRLVTADGVTCDAKVTGFRLLSRSIPHFSVRQRWNTVPRSVAAPEAWASGNKILVADTDEPCERALWAQAAGEPAPAVDDGVRADEPLAKRALAELRKSADWKRIQKSYLEESPSADVTRWDELKDAKVDVRQFRALRAGKEIQLVSVALTLWPGCNEFGADLWGLFEERDGTLIPRNTPGTLQGYPISVVDSDGDGNSELLTVPFPTNFDCEKGRVLLHGELWDDGEQIEVPYLDCPC